MKLMRLALPGPQRDTLVPAVLDGVKTTTTALIADFEHCAEALPRKGERHALVDSAERIVAEVEFVDVQVCALSDVDIQHVLDEGEGYLDCASWRRGHEEFFHSDAMRAALDDPGFTADDTTLVVLQRLRVVRLVEDPHDLGQ